jgi:hypothetical protein
VGIAGTLFLLAWHTRGHAGNPALVSLGLACLFVAILDVFRLLGFSGIGVFETHAYSSDQVWVVARGLQALGLRVFAFLEPRGDRNFAWSFA